MISLLVVTQVCLVNLCRDKIRSETFSYVLMVHMILCVLIVHKLLFILFIFLFYIYIYFYFIFYFLLCIKLMKLQDIWFHPSFVLIMEFFPRILRASPNPVVAGMLPYTNIRQDYIFRLDTFKFLPPALIYIYSEGEHPLTPKHYYLRASPKPCCSRHATIH